ncbi:NUDIX domain [Popillia japonica]|uniref:NUDIX domain n=1 Tax=Popillia japonica TaxID=7064 RepID=A0AAW1KFI9_POPJA
MFLDSLVTKSSTYSSKLHMVKNTGHLQKELLNLARRKLKLLANVLLEESGLTKEDLKVYEQSKRILQYVVKNKPKIVVYWLAELVNPNAEIKLSSEHTEFKWLDMDNLRAYAKYEDMINLVEDYNNFIKLNKL